jgi:hypothetical protein
MAIFVKYGDQAAEAMIRHKEIAEPVVAAYGQSAAKALAAVDAQNGRRIAMMVHDGDLARIGRPRELLDVVGNYGDRAADFVWKNKGALAVGVTLVAFLHEPKPFIDGAKDITTVVAQNTVKPIAEEAAKQINWTLVVVLLVLVTAGLLAVRSYRRRAVHAIQLRGPSSRT